MVGAVRSWSTICYSQSDQGLHCLPFSALWSRSTLAAIFSSLFKVKVYTVILRNSPIMDYTICHSQQSDQGLHYLPFSAFLSESTLFAIPSILIRVYTICHSQQSDQCLYCHSQQSNQGLHYFPFSAVWSISSSTVILRNSLNRVHTICHSQQSDQDLHCLPFSAFWSGSTLFAILSSLNRVYTICRS